MHINDLLLVYPTKRSLHIDYNELEKFDPELADILIKQPDMAIAAAEEAITDMNLSLPEGIESFSPHARFTNVPSDEMLIEQLSSKNINELVAFRAIVTKRAEVMHRVKIGVYKCEVCDSEVRVLVTKNFTPPKRCDSCKKFAMKQVDDESKFTDIQRAEVQELLERVRGGAPAAHIELWLEDDIVNTMSPGDNVELMGMLRLRPPLKMRQKQEMLYSRYIEVISIRSLKREFEEIEVSKEEERHIIEISRDPNVEQRIIESLAPAIYGYKEVKHALALQLFGGTKGKQMHGGLTLRDDIHVLLIGDPGVAKSRFLQSVNAISPKGIYVSGKSVSGVGLTVSAEKDELGEGGWTLKAGALVLASGGTAQIDEFDKIEEADRAALHEVMESGMVSIAKAGMVARFRSKTAILAAANPKYGRFDQTKNLAEQFAIPPSLMSRFDLIFPIIDILDDEKDSKLATNILATHMGKKNIEREETLLDKELLRKYIAYARRNISPQLSQAASDRIRDFYVGLRRRSKDAGAVAITPRYLEGLVRLSEANAKMRLSNIAEERDALVAIALFEHVMRQVMTDRTTGVFDADIIAVGRSKTETAKLQKHDTVVDIIKEHLRRKESADVEEVVKEAEGYGMSAEEARKILAELLRRGFLYEPQHGHVKLVRE
jgi:replicative DNA helicase Mcm